MDTRLSWRDDGDGGAVASDGAGFQVAAIVRRDRSPWPPRWLAHVDRPLRVLNEYPSLAEARAAVTRWWSGRSPERARQPWRRSGR